MAMKIFAPDLDATVTPFNQSQQTNKKIDTQTIAMADTIQGISQKNARMWQIIALVSLLSFFISLGICLYAIHLPKTVPVIVTVDTQGQATYIGAVDKSYWGKDKIPENAKVYQFKRLVANMFTWVTDKNAQNQYIHECEKICQGNAMTLLNDFYHENNPFNWIGIKTRSVVMEEPLRQTERTYVMYFNIITYDQGKEESNERFSMLVTFDYFQGVPKDNPLGIYITNFDIKKYIRKPNT